MLKALEHLSKLYSVNLYVSRVHTKFLIIFLAYGSSATTHTMPCRLTVHEDPVEKKVVVLGHWLFKLPPTRCCFMAFWCRDILPKTIVFLFHLVLFLECI
jgi:hypothetical protein